jgi:putative DNA primase/helicase
LRETLVKLPDSCESTLLTVIQEVLLGPANVSNISWHNLGETFLTAELDGRLANIFADRSEAFYRRLVIIPFGPPKPPAQRDLHLKDKLAREAPGILNWALAGLLRLIDNGYRFSESTASRSALDQYRVAGSSVLSFVEDCCVLDARRQVSAAQLYHGYQQYSNGSGLRPVSQKRFWMELKESSGMVEREKENITRRSIYLGIDLEELADLG